MKNKNGSEIRRRKKKAFRQRKQRIEGVGKKQRSRSKELCFGNVLLKRVLSENTLEKGEIKED